MSLRRCTRAGAMRVSFITCSWSTPSMRWRTRSPVSSGSIGRPFWYVFTSLIAPVGLRYHALHHHLPSLPYHSLGAVHRALVAELPPDSPYHRTERDSVLEPVQKLWNEAAV